MKHPVRKHLVITFPRTIFSFEIKLDLTNGDQLSPKEYVSSHSTHQSRQQQEAYCNLCERSFCNKYFLKTHFAKKHGGLSMISPLSLTERNDNVNGSLSPSSSLPLSNQQAASLITNQQSSTVNNSKSTEKSNEDYCEVCCCFVRQRRQFVDLHFLMFRFVRNIFVINIIFV